jgi:hypothetical protein
MILNLKRPPHMRSSAELLERIGELEVEYERAGLPGTQRYLARLIEGLEAILKSRGDA